jgi:glycosyltransferase involved in cell wall biosynthesis
MVKNEELAIKDTLQPFIDGGSTHFLIFDTGSMDRTIEIAQALFIEYNLDHAFIVQEPFIDFATSRNHALETAEALFPTVPFMLMPDAEWYIHGIDTLIQFCHNHLNDFHNSYSIRITDQYNSFMTARLIRNHKHVRFVGSVHECLNQLTPCHVPETCYFEWRPSRQGDEKSRARWARDRDLLLKDYHENPLNIRTVFYLAQTYHCLGELESALLFYEKYTKLNGVIEEHYTALYQMGSITERLAEIQDPSLYALAIYRYLEAYSFRPCRAEPLIRLADMYLRQEKKELAFLFAKKACEISYPINEQLVVNRYLYEFSRYEIASRAAWYIGEYEFGEWAAREILKYYPNKPHLQRNLQYYIERINRLRMPE